MHRHLPEPQVIQLVPRQLRSRPLAPCRPRSVDVAEFVSVTLPESINRTVRYGNPNKHVDNRRHQGSYSRYGYIIDDCNAPLLDTIENGSFLGQQPKSPYGRLFTPQHLGLTDIDQPLSSASNPYWKLANLDRCIPKPISAILLEIGQADQIRFTDPR